MLLPLLVGAVLIDAIAPAQDIAVPLRLHATVGLAPLLVAMPAAAAAMVIQRPDPYLERAVARLRYARALWWGTVLVLLAVVGWVAAYSAEPSAAVVTLRNVALVLGLTTWSSAIFGPAWAWAAPILVLGVSVFYGTNDASVPQAWAVLQLGTTSVVSSVAAAVLAASAWLFYAWHDVRS